MNLKVVSTNSIAYQDQEEFSPIINLINNKKYKEAKLYLLEISEVDHTLFEEPNFIVLMKIVDSALANYATTVIGKLELNIRRGSLGPALNSYRQSLLFNPKLIASDMHEKILLLRAYKEKYLANVKILRIFQERFDKIKKRLLCEDFSGRTQTSITNLIKVAGFQGSLLHDELIDLVNGTDLSVNTDTPLNGSTLCPMPDLSLIGGITDAELKLIAESLSDENKIEVKCAVVEALFSHDLKELAMEKLIAIVELYPDEEKSDRYNELVNMLTSDGRVEISIEEELATDFKPVYDLILYEKYNQAIIKVSEVARDYKLKIKEGEYLKATDAITLAIKKALEDIYDLIRDGKQRPARELYSNFVQNKKELKKHKVVSACVDAIDSIPN